MKKNYKKQNGLLEVTCMKKINIYLTSAIIAVVSVSSYAASDTSSSTLNKQKTTIRNEMSLIELENNLYQRKNEGLQLQIENKQLEMQKTRVYSSDDVLYLDDLSDPVFGEGLTEEDQMSFGNNSVYGKKNIGGDSAYSMNAKDKKRRTALSDDDIEGGKINLQELQKKIKEMIASEVKSMKKDEASYAPVTTVPSLDSIIDMTANMNQSENTTKLNVSDKGSRTSLVEMEVIKMVKFAEKSKATVLAKFEIRNGLRSSMIEDVELELEEGQIYTYYGKVYLVKTISNKTVVIRNSTDKVDIIQHL